MRYNTKGVKLITADDGSVTGIYAQDTSANKYLKINAKKRHPVHGRLPGQRGHDEVLRAGVRGERQPDSVA